MFKKDAVSCVGATAEERMNPGYLSIIPGSSPEKRAREDRTLPTKTDGSVRCFFLLRIPRREGPESHPYYEIELLPGVVRSRLAWIKAVQ